MFLQKLFSLFFLISYVVGNCTLHEELHSYYNISDLGRAVILNFTNEEIDNLLDNGCDVNYDRTCVDYQVNTERHTWLDGYGGLPEMIY